MIVEAYAGNDVKAPIHPGKPPVKITRLFQIIDQGKGPGRIAPEIKSDGGSLPKYIPFGLILLVQLAATIPNSDKEGAAELFEQINANKAK